MEWRSLVHIEATDFAKYICSAAVGALDVCTSGGADQTRWRRWAALHLQ